MSVCVCVWLRRLLRSKKRYDVCVCVRVCVRKSECVRVCVVGGCLFMCVFVCVCFVWVILCECVLRVGVCVRWAVQ